MQFDELMQALSPERYKALCRAVELGKWPDGRILGQEEREISLQLLIAHDAKFKARQDRIGYVPAEKLLECEHDGDHHQDHPDSQNVIFKG